MPLSLDLRYDVPAIDFPQEGDTSAGDFGAQTGGFEESWWYPDVSSESSETMASADVAGNSGGMATIRNMWGYGSVWRRGLVLLRGGVLAVVDDVALGPSQQSGGAEFIAGPVFALNSGASDGPHLATQRSATLGQVSPTDIVSYWNVRGFGSNGSLLVAMAGASHANSTICNTMVGASSCRPDIASCNATAMCGRRQCICPHTSIFGYSPLSGSSRSTVVVRAQRICRSLWFLGPTLKDCLC